METATLIVELVVTFVGIFVGTLLAMAVDHARARRRKRQRAQIVLRALSQELRENDATLMAVRDAYINTPWGKSFYVSTMAWETAQSSGDLPDIIGFELADTIEAQYGLLIRLRYYVNLLTQLWFAPTDIDGYEEIRQGFREAILDTMTQALNHFPRVIEAIDEARNGHDGTD
jgi:hypothetical protein